MEIIAHPPIKIGMTGSSDHIDVSAPCYTYAKKYNTKYQNACIDYLFSTNMYRLGQKFLDIFQPPKWMWNVI